MTPATNPRNYSTKQMLRITGITARQAQWWHEKGLIPVVIDGHRRVWDENDVLMVMLIQALRDKGLSLIAVRKLVRQLKKRRADYFVIINTHGEWLKSEADVIEWFKRASEGALLLYLPDFISKIGGEE